MKPITPKEVGAKKAEVLPPDVIDEWNKAIATAWDGASAEVVQDDIVAALAKRMNVDREQVFERGWVEVEEMYRAAGWRVSYDKPAYNESYPATFTFTKGRNR